MYNQDFEKAKDNNDNIPDKNPKPEIPIPSTTPLTSPIPIPGIDRTNPTPEHDTTNMPEENPIPLVLPEIDPNTRLDIDEHSPPIAANRIGFY